jgi:TolB-like protein/AraC-like DNA-binding protein
LTQIASETLNSQGRQTRLRNFLRCGSIRWKRGKTAPIPHPSMPELPENEFLTALNDIVEKNISNEQFGVSELAEQMNMSRSNLLRKVKKETNLSVTQLISKVRLTRAMELLKKGNLNVSEVSHEVGFNSTSYFIKCFREYYGYPPGEVGKRDVEVEAPVPGKLSGVPETKGAFDRRRLSIFIPLVTLLLIFGGYMTWYTSVSHVPLPAEKSIAVLPFKNDSNDSSNLYLINGLMEATLNNLQQIKDLRVTSRTSVEKYRTTTKSIREMGSELGVNYFVEGSGQKIGDKILLNIQLIDATTDRHLWAKQYRREAKDIFELQKEIAENIAEEIEVIITPEVQQRIEKIPTQNLEAYDEFLKGRELFNRSGPGDFEQAIKHFEKAIELDPDFALSYASASMVFYYLDFFRLDARYTEKISRYSDKAMLLDPKSGESLIAKGVYFIHIKEYESAVPYFEKALTQHPGHGLVLHFLVESYSLYVPHPRKYLEYAILKDEVNKREPLDSGIMAFNNLHLANAYLQCGFVKEARTYIRKSAAYQPDGFFTGYLMAYIDFFNGATPEQTKNALIRELKKQPGRFDLKQEIGKMYCFLQNYDSAFFYYKQFVTERKMLKMDLFHVEDMRIADVFERKGLKAEAEELKQSYKKYCDETRTIYKDVCLAMYYAHEGDMSKAVEYMQRFAGHDNFVYWILLMKDDPESEKFMKNPEFRKAFETVEKKFWKTHEEIKAEMPDA